MKHLWWKFVGACTLLGVITILVIMVAPKSPVEPDIKRQLTSTLLLPKTSLANVDRDSVKYDPSAKLLSYKIAYADTTVTVSEQPTPDQFTDIPAAYAKVVEGMNNYSTFEVNIGTVHLTRSAQLAGQQAAVLNTKGTLLFAKPDKDLSDDQWKILFRNFVAEN